MQMLLNNFFLLIFVGWIESSPFDPPPVEPNHYSFSPRNELDYRLPEGAVEVEHYDLEIRVNEDTLTTTHSFEGITTITFTNLKNTNEIKLHANKLEFQSVKLTNSSGEEILLEKQEIENQTDILTLLTSQPLEEDNEYKIKFEYLAHLRTDEMYGFYKSTYLDSNGIEHVLGTTQFQPTHARKAFPCFDEPSYKAKFDIKIRHPKELSAVSNAKESSTRQDGNFIITTFETTPRMPTYLIAFVVSDFTCSETDPVDVDIKSYICSRDDAKETRQLAIDYAPKLTWALENFTGISYSTSTLKKIHQFAIPDFSAGAMENWGLITYRETALLWDTIESSNRYKQRVITVVAHELAHFWFGNLVTTHWWSDTFLNEGFATYFEYHIPQEVDPTLETDKQFVIEQLQTVLVSDASPVSAALSSPASSPSQISGRFSSISYNKGGSIFRMVEHFMGLENFKKGINQYLTDNQFNNTRPDDLWEALEPYAELNIRNKDLKAVMENWVNNPGYPVLNVSTDGLKLKLSQKRFLSRGEADSSQMWYIPISYTTASDTNKFESTKPSFWMLPPGSLTMFDILKNENDWIIVNNQQTGYYRVDYSKDLWNKIKVALNKDDFDGIHELNRAQIVDDYFNFARYGYKSFSDLLELYNFLKHETSYYPWYSAFTAFSNMVARTSSTHLRQELSDYILKLIEHVYSTIPFKEVNDENQIYTHKKVLIIPWACRLGLQDCINNAVAAFDEYKKSNVRPDKNLRTAIYCNGLRHSKNIEEDWNFLWDKFLNTKLATEQVTILSALGCTTDRTILENYLRKSIDPNSGIRQQDALSVFSAVYSGNFDGVDVAFDFFIKNYKNISEYYGTMNSLSSLFSGLANRFTKEEQANKLADFIENNDLGDATNIANAALNTALTNLEWIKRFENEMNLYFNSLKSYGENLSVTKSLILGATFLLIYVQY